MKKAEDRTAHRALLRLLGILAVPLLIIIYVAGSGPVLRSTSIPPEESYARVSLLYLPLVYISLEKGWFPPLEHYLRWWKVQLMFADDGTWLVLGPSLNQN